MQFIYGEDGIAGENIEDLVIETIRQSNEQIDKRYNFFSEATNSANHGIQELEMELAQYYEPALIDQILADERMRVKVQEEHQ